MRGRRGGPIRPRSPKVPRTLWPALRPHTELGFGRPRRQIRPYPQHRIKQQRPRCRCSSKSELREADSGRLRRMPAPECRARLSDTPPVPRLRQGCPRAGPLNEPILGMSAGRSVGRSVGRPEGRGPHLAERSKTRQHKCAYTTWTPPDVGWGRQTLGRDPHI